jgi:hypothetical protein
MREYDNFNISTFRFSENINFDRAHLREEVSFQTFDLEIVYNKKVQGWVFKTIKEGFIIRAPEVWLVDLSDPYKITYYNKVEINLAYYLFLKDLIANDGLNDFIKSILKNNSIENFDFYILKGQSLGSEIRISGSDLRIHLLKDLIFETATSLMVWNKYLDKAVSFLENFRQVNIKKISLSQMNEKIQDFYNRLMEIYLPFNVFNKDVFNTLFIKDLFKDIPDFDVYIFIPWGCFRYILSYATTGDFDRVMFWEYHADRDKLHMNHYMTKDLNKKRVLIIDNSYSGKTLSRVSKMVKIKD